MQVALTPHPQAPPCMLRQGMDHMVQETDARVDGNDLALALLGGMFLLVCLRIGLVDLVPEVGVREGVEGAAVEVQRDLHLGFVGVAGDGGGAGHGCGCGG